MIKSIISQYASFLQTYIANLHPFSMAKDQKKFIIFIIVCLIKKKLDTNENYEIHS